MCCCQPVELNPIAVNCGAGLPVSPASPASRARSAPGPTESPPRPALSTLSCQQATPLRQPWPTVCARPAQAPLVRGWHCQCHCRLAASQPVATKVTWALLQKDAEDVVCDEYRICRLPTRVLRDSIMHTMHNWICGYGITQPQGATGASSMPVHLSPPWWYSTQHFQQHPPFTFAATSSKDSTTGPVCKLCPADTYGPGGSIDSCQPCPQGTNSPAGSRDQAACVAPGGKREKVRVCTAVPGSLEKAR